MPDEERRADYALLARLDERTETIERDLKVIRDSLGIYVTRDRFRPVEMITFGLACLALAAVVSALLKGLTL